MREFRRLVADTHAVASNLLSEAAAKVAILRAQAMRLDGPARQAVEHGAAVVRSGLDARAARLDRMAERAGASRFNWSLAGCEASFEEDDS